jgi:hypothetical protein
MQDIAVPTKKKPKTEAKASAAPDPRAALAPTAANLQLVLTELEQVLASVPPPKVEAVEGEAAAPPLPQLDLVEAMLHIYFADGLPCGYGQEARRRIQDSFVDRNEFRVTEAFEVEDLLRDLEIPDLFDRCLAVRDSIAQVYNDQNGVNLGFLREAGISDRNTFFQRVPALQPHVVNVPRQPADDRGPVLLGQVDGCAPSSGWASIRRTLPPTSSSTACARC